MVRAETTFSLKDQLFNKKSVERLAGFVDQASSSFKKDLFIKETLGGFKDRELKERIVWIREKLHDQLPPAYPKALKIILKSLPTELDSKKTDDDFGDFIIAPLSDYVAHYGCQEEYLEESLETLREITKRFSAEDAIRYFINAFPKRTLSFLEECSNDSNYHVRRLSSEGSRPKLPWSQKVVYKPSDALEILNTLYSDHTRYVTRSVANHLNDISKIDPGLVVETLLRWKKEGKQNPREMDFIMNHSLRTLIKKGDTKALELLGFYQPPKVKLYEFSILTPVVAAGEKLEFFLEIISTAKQSLVADYTVYFVSKSKNMNKKVFKITKGAYAKNEIIQINKKHPMKIMTTRALLPGTHYVEIQINGVVYGKLPFELKLG